MRRTTALAATLAISLTALLCAAAFASRPGQRAAPPAPAPQTGANAPGDLSGTYPGVFEDATTSAVVPAHLKIEGRRFTLTTADGTTHTGTVKTKVAPDATLVVLEFDQPPVSTGAPRPRVTLTLEARWAGSRLRLMPQDATGPFSFHSSPARTRGRDPASADSNTSNTSANLSGNTSVNTNPLINTNRANRDGNTGTTKDGNSGPVTPPTHNANAHVRAHNANAAAPGGENANARPSPAPSPAATPAAPSTGDPEIDALLRKLHDGQLALKAPDTVRQGETVPVTARIAFDDIGEQIKAGMPGAGEASAEPVKVGQFMKVTLLAEEPDAFTIRELTDAEQLIAGRPFAEWRWSVTPLRSGRHTLHLRATTNLLVPGRGEKPYPVPVIDKQIEVRVSFGYVVRNFLSDKDNWKIVFGGLTVPGALAGLWKFLQSRRRKKGGGGGDTPAAAGTPAAD